MFPSPTSLLLYGIVDMNGGCEMTVGDVYRAVGTRNIPEPVRMLSSLPGIDYADQFTLSPHAHATPEQRAWARFGEVPSVTELLIWRGLLGLRLIPARSPATMAGWQIGDRGDDWIRLEAGSWCLAGNLLVHIADGPVSLGTFRHYHRLLGRSVWPPLSAIHRRLGPGVLRHAAARLAISSARTDRTTP